MSGPYPLPGGNPAPSGQPRRERRAQAAKGRRQARDMRRAQARFDAAGCSLCGQPDAEADLYALGLDPQGKPAGICGPCCRSAAPPEGWLILGFGASFTNPPAEAPDSPWRRDDAAWFRVHPGREFRLRRVLDGEAAGLSAALRRVLADADDEGAEAVERLLAALIGRGAAEDAVAVIVSRVAPGLRLRRLALLTEDALRSEWSDAGIRRLLDEGGLPEFADDVAGTA